MLESYKNVHCRCLFFETKRNSQLNVILMFPRFNLLTITLITRHGHLIKVKRISVLGGTDPHSCYRIVFHSLI